MSAASLKVVQEPRLCNACGQEVINSNQVQFDALSGDISFDDLVVRLTKCQSRFFLFLWSSNGEVVSYERLFDDMYWQKNPNEWPEFDVIKVHACNIKRKLKDFPLKIETVWGVGYRLKLNLASVQIAGVV